MNTDHTPGATVGADRTPGLDATAIARLRELDPDGRHGVVPRVLSAFETVLTRMLTQLSAPSAERPEGGHGPDPAVVVSVAHTLKSSSASVGALSLARACADVERRLRAGEPGDLDVDVARLQHEGQGALKAVRAMLRP